MTRDTIKRIIPLLAFLVAGSTSYAQTSEPAILQDFDTGVRFMGIVSMFTCAILLVFTNRGRVNSRIYNRTRLLMVIATTVLGSLMAAQFFGHLREQTPCISWAVSLLALSIVLPCMALGQMNLLRAGHKMRLPVMKVAYFTSTCYVLIGIGYFTDTLGDSGEAWRSATALVAAIFTIKLLRMMRLILRDMSSVRLNLNDEELEMRKNVLKYTSMSMNFILGFSLISPWIGLITIPVVHSIHGFVMFGLMLWYVGGILIYGNKMDEVITIEDEIREALDREQKRHASTTEDDRHTAEAVEKWVASKGFADPSICIDMVSQSMGITPGTLSRYLCDYKDIKYRNWISQLRIEYAKELILQNPNYSIQAIADLCGFKDRTSFQRTFAQLVGVPPRQWANQTEHEQG